MKTKRDVGLVIVIIPIAQRDSSQAKPVQNDRTINLRKQVSPSQREAYVTLSEANGSLGFPQHSVYLKL